MSADTDTRPLLANRIELKLGPSWTDCALRVDGRDLYCWSVTVVARVGHATEVHVAHEVEVESDPGEYEMRREVFVTKNLVTR